MRRPVEIPSSNYVFDASAKTITFNGIAGLSLESFSLITNTTDNVVIYQFQKNGKGATFASNVLALEYDTTLMDDADLLKINATVEEYTNPLPISGEVSIIPETGGESFGSIKDSSGNGYHGTLVGSTQPSFINSPFEGFGKALSFDGVDRGNDTMGMQVPDAASLFTGTQPFTIEANIRQTATGTYSAIVSKYKGNQAGSNYLFAVNYSNLEIFVYTPTGYIFVIGGAITNNVNHKVACVYDGNTVYLFVDGVLATSSVVGALAGGVTAKTYIGRCWDVDYPNAFQFTGSIDEVRISNVARHTTNYTPSAIPFVADANTVALYHFDTYSVSQGQLETAQEQLAALQLLNIEATQQQILNVLIQIRDNQLNGNQQTQVV